METKLLVLDINQEDLVDLLTTASYGSHIFDIDYDSIDYDNVENKDCLDCFEDKIAKCLLNGKKMLVYDKFAEGERDGYGKCPHVWNEDERTMDYKVTLDDVIEGIQKCFTESAFGMKCVCDLISREGNLDLDEAEYIMQFIVFGEYIYA